ncbi:MAG: hypothetical protein KGZ25_03905, partial [Planctomycetes bacterium]|nr:hypothetical protein [Planctomycetota bacterium]
MNGGLGRKFVVLVAVLLPVFLCGPVSRAEEQNFPGEAAIERLLAESDEAEGKRREKLLREAVERARKSAASIKEKVHSPRPGQAAREEAIVDWFSVRLRMADILGMRRGRPVIARMKLSLSTSEQRQKLCLLLSESLKELEEIQTDLKRRQKWAEDDSAREVNLAPRLERLGWQLRWQRAFTRYWKARATAEGSERIRLLEKTIADVEKMVSAFSAGSPRQRLQLLKGSCLREKGKHKKAVRLLSQLAGQPSSADLREKVFFELARARIDFAGSDSAWADADSPGTPAAFRQAVEAVAKYQALSPKPDPKTLIDVRAMMFHERFYSREIKREDADAERVRNRLDEALRDFLSRHRSPSSRALVAKLFLRRWSQKQINNAPPSVLVLLAAHRLSRGDSGGTSRPDSKQRHDLRRDLQKAIDLAERAKKQDRDGRNPIVPETLWIIGRAKAKQGKRLQATEAYEKLSRNYPSHSLAKAAALERARICDRMLESALAGGNTSVRKYRKAFVDALSVLATNWDEDNDADRWQLAIGARCAALAREADSDQQFKRWARRAVESYGQIKSQKYTGLMADFLALEQEYKLARRTAPSDREQAAKLARRLQALSTRLKKRTESDSNLTEPKKKQLADRACRCELYALLLRHSVLGDKGALNELSTLRERWSGCDAVGAADRYLFEDALRNQRLKEAAESLRHFRRSYGTDKTKELAD